MASQTTKNIISKLASKPFPSYFPVWDSYFPTYSWNAILVSYSTLARENPKIPYDKEKTVIMAESGGFLSGGAPKTWHECITNQMKVSPDIVFPLDYPLKQKLSRISTPKDEMHYANFSDNERENVLKINIKIAKETVRSKEFYEGKTDLDFEVCPIVHGYDLSSVKNSAEELSTLECNFFALGAISTDASTRLANITSAIESIQVVRDAMGKDRWLHLLGVTDVRFLLRVKPVINSFDSTTAYIQAKNRQEILSTYGSRYVGTQSSYSKLSARFDGSTSQLAQKNFKNQIQLFKNTIWQ